MLVFQVWYKIILNIYYVSFLLGLSVYREKDNFKNGGEVKRL